MSEHTCTVLGVSSPGCGALSGSDLGLLVAGCVDDSWCLLLFELLFVLILKDAQTSIPYQ
jgi:hypothetical protein